MEKVDNRTKNSTRNMVFAAITYFVQLILAFLLRRNFIYFFNEEYLGLNSLFTNVLSVLSLAELGFGSAVVFAMYKPMADGDKEKVRQLLHFYKTSYMIIGVVVAVLGLMVLPFMNYFQSKAPNVDANLYIVYLIFLASNVVSYMLAYRRSLLYTSQRNDIESKITLLSFVFSSLLQFLILFFIKNYYLYISVNIVSTLLSNILIYIITEKKYGEYVKKPAALLDKDSRKAINKNIFALVFHKIGSVVVYSTDSLIIYLFLNAATLGKYSNYLLITSSVASLIAIFSNAMRGSVGNSIAKESVEHNYKLLNKLNFIYFWIVSFCTICIFVLSDPFIDVVFTKGDADLTLNGSVLALLCLSFYLNNTRYLTGMFKECAGIFYQDRFKSIVESVVNLAVSVVLVKIIGLPGVIIGTIVSTISTSLWIEPYVLNKNYLKKSTIKYFGKYLIYSVAMLASAAITYFACSLVSAQEWAGLIIKIVLCAVVPNISLLVLLCWMPEFRDCLKWGVQILKTIKLKLKNRAAAENKPGETEVLVSNVDLDKDGIVDIGVPVDIKNEE